MKMDLSKLLATLKVLKPGLAGSKEIIEQSNCFVFKNGRVWTYNDEMAVSVEFELGEGVEEFAVPSQSLISILEKLPDGEIDVKVTPTRLSFKAGKNRRVGLTVEQDVILPVKEIGSPKEWKALPENFSQALNLTGFSTSTKAVGGQAALVNIAVMKDYVISCDMYRATRYDLEEAMDEELLIPGKATSAIAQHNPLEYGLTQGWLHLLNEDGVVLAIRIDDTPYPIDPVLGLFEVEGESLELPKGLKQAVECAMVFSENERGSLAFIDISVKDGAMVIQGKNGKGFFKERIQAEASNLAFKIDPKLMLDCISLGSTLTVSDKSISLKAEHFQHIAALAEEE